MGMRKRVWICMLLCLQLRLLLRLSSRPVCWRRRRGLCALPAVVVLLVHREGHGGGSHCCLGAWRQHIVAGSGVCVVSHAAAAWSCGKRGSRSRRQERRSSTTPKLSPEDGQLDSQDRLDGQRKKAHRICVDVLGVAVHGSIFFFG